MNSPLAWWESPAVLLRRTVGRWAKEVYQILDRRKTSTKLSAPVKAPQTQMRHEIPTPTGTLSPGGAHLPALRRNIAAGDSHQADGEFNRIICFFISQLFFIENQKKIRISFSGLVATPARHAARRPGGRRPTGWGAPSGCKVDALGERKL